MVTGETDEEHLCHLEQVLQRLQKYNIRARREKCAFMSTSVEYLGHVVDAQGLHTTLGKVEAISQAPEPTNVQELRSFLGLLHYYGKFMPDLASLLHPLNNILKSDTKWTWSDTCTRAFKQAKRLLVTAPVLAHYNPDLPIKLAADASAYGVGAVLSHMYPDGSERPVAFASRTLSATERNYAQVEKEALSLVFGVRKFHQYLYGRRFVLITDHKPLTTLLGPKHGIPPLAAARLQRWALLLTAYTYSIEYKATKEHANADGLSRLPLGTRHDPAMDVFMIGQLQALPVTTERLETTTRQDPLLSKLHQYVREGWPGESSEEFKPFEQRKQELSTLGGCVLWGNRVIVPQKLRDRLVDELHRDHPGVSRMKAIARSYMWWPGIDKELEDRARRCTACQSVKSAPAVAPLHPWLWPSTPWQRIHVDFAGPFMGKMFLVVIDAHSKWPEVVEMPSTTAQKTVDELRKLFSAYGLPEQLVSDNGPQFVAQEFGIFLKENGVKHIWCSPYHPSSNGAAERFVQTFKQAMKAGVETTPALPRRISNFLLTYRSTPHATTNTAPCELFLGRHVRNRFDILRPNQAKKVSDRQASQKAHHDYHAKERCIGVGQPVMVRNWRQGAPWVPGVIEKQLGPLTFLVRTREGLLWKRHMDHVRALTTQSQSVSMEEQDEFSSTPPHLSTEPLAPVERTSHVPPHNEHIDVNFTSISATGAYGTGPSHVNWTGQGLTCTILCMVD